MRKISIVAGLRYFLHGVGHFPRRKKLSLFQVHHAARFSGSHKQVRLPRKKRGNLQDVGDFGHGRRLRRFMNVRQDRNPEALLDFFQDAQTFRKPRASIRLFRRAIGLVIGSLENKRHLGVSGDFREPLGHHQRVLFAFNDARSGNQEQRLVAADADASNRDFPRHLHSEFSLNLEADHSVCGTAKFCNGKPGNANLPIGELPCTRKQVV